MGMMTTITIRNDAAGEIKKYPEEFAEKVYNACSGSMRGHLSSDKEFGLGFHANMAVCQQPIDSHVDRVYVQSGGTVCEMGAYSSYTEHLMHEHTDFFDRMLEHMEYTVKVLKQKRKVIKGKQDE